MNGRTRGQALVELALAMPILLVTALGVVGAGRTIYARVAIDAAAREGARAVATAPDPCDASIGAGRARETASNYGLDLSRLQVQVGGGCGRGELRSVVVTYTVRLQDLAFVPFFQLPGGEVTMSATATHMVEQYRSR